MKRFEFTISLVVLVLGLVAFGFPCDDGPNPDYQWTQVQALHDQFSSDVSAAIAEYIPDFHPCYGYVGIDDMPVHSDGWQDAYISELYPGETVDSYFVEQITITGRILMNHMDPMGNEFFVWHEVVDEPVNYIMAKLVDSRLYHGRIVGPRCGNAVAVYINGMFRGWIEDGQYFPY